MGYEGPERRAGPRVRFKEPVKLEGSGFALECRGLDLSVSGIGVELAGTAPWPLGMTLDLRFTPPGGSEVACAGWLVRRFDHHRHLERFRSQGLGIAFEDLSPEQQEEITSFVEEHLAGEMSSDDAQGS